MWVLPHGDASDNLAGVAGMIPADPAVIRSAPDKAYATTGNTPLDGPRLCVPKVTPMVPTEQQFQKMIAPGATTAPD